LKTKGKGIQEMQNIRLEGMQLLHEIGGRDTDVVVGVDAAGKRRKFDEWHRGRSRVRHSRADDNDFISASLQSANQVQCASNNSINFRQKNLGNDRNSHAAPLFESDKERG
jgi:hypothetical protein